MMRMQSPKNPGSLDTDRGVALVVALLMMLVLTLLGSGLAMSSLGGIQVGTSFNSQQEAFQVAEAGLEHAREHLRALRFQSQSTSFDDLLDSARTDPNTNAPGTLVDGVRLVNFDRTTGFVNGTTNTPLVLPQALGLARYQVFLNNDPAEGVTNPEDENELVMLTSFGSGPNGIGFSAVQAVYQVADLPDLPQLPGLVNLPGPEVDFHSAVSAPFEVDGDGGAPSCLATVAVTSTRSESQVESEIARPSGSNGRGSGNGGNSGRGNSGNGNGGSPQSDNYTTCHPYGGRLTGADTVENFINNSPGAGGDPNANPYDSATNDPLLMETTETPDIVKVDYLNDLVAGLRAVADYVGTGYARGEFGSPSDPKLVVIDGDLEIPGGTDLGGILVVTGELTINGNASYTGTIYAIGQGSVVRNGAGNANIHGGILVANTDEPWTGDPRYVGIPSYRHNGGGISFQGPYEFGASGDLYRLSRPLERVSFQQLR